MFDRKNEPCRVDQILVQRRRPAPRRLSTRRAAIDLDEDGIALAGLPWRAQHLIIEVGSIRGLDGAEGRKNMAVPLGRVRLRGVQPIFCDTGKALSAGQGEYNLTRRAGA